jgi:hypothetical protein
MIKSRNIFAILILLFLTGGCSLWEKDKPNTTPNPIIPREKMISILADMQITEAYLNDLRKSGHKTKDSSLLYYEKIFKKNEISQSDFKANLLYYKEDLGGLEKMYTDMITHLNELKAKNEEMLLQMKADSIYQDSLKKVQLLNDSLFFIQREDSIKRSKFIHDSINKLNDTIFAK